MAIIDSDAHVLETDRTWDYMLDSEREMRPRIVPTPKDASSGGESWLWMERILARPPTSATPRLKNRARWKISGRVSSIWTS